MRVFAACAASYEESVRRAAGVPPVLSPPLQMRTFDPAVWSGYDFYYLKLHGLEYQPFFYGDNFVTACSASQIREVDMDDAVVFVAGCNLFDPIVAGEKPEGAMVKALFVAGAAAVLGGAGENFAARFDVVGCDVLGEAFRKLVGWGLSPASAFKLARLKLQGVFRAGKGKRELLALDDALAFRLVEREGRGR